MSWLPTASVPLANVAWPLPSSATAEASTVAPSLKSTVPVGVPAPGATGATVAVNVTVCPDTLGLTSAPSVVVVSAWLTVWLNPGLVLAPKLLSPL